MLLCLPFTEGHFGKVHLVGPPLSVAVLLLLCFQNVQEVECTNILGCEVSIGEM